MRHIDISLDATGACFVSFNIDFLIMCFDSIPSFSSNICKRCFCIYISKIFFGCNHSTIFTSKYSNSSRPPLQYILHITSSKLFCRQHYGSRYIFWGVALVVGLGARAALGIEGASQAVAEQPKTPDIDATG